MRWAKSLATPGAAVVLATAALALLPAAQGQGAPSLCFGCSVDVEVLEWNGTGLPGAILNGTLRVTNTGQLADTYDVAIEPSDALWLAEASIEETPELQPGSGPLADTSAASVEFQVHMLVPDNAQAGDSAGFTVTVTSQSDPEVTDNVGEAARALQFYGWDLTCTPSVQVQKADVGDVEATATNRGNGNDAATISVAPLAGLSLTEPERVSTIGPGISQSQTIDLGVGISLEDGDYTLRWDLRSVGSPDAKAQCTTLLQVTGGTPQGDGDPAKKKDSPAPTPAAWIVGAVGLVALVRAMDRRRA